MSYFPLHILIFLPTDGKRKRERNEDDRAFAEEVKKLRPDIELGSLGNGEGITMDNPIKTLRYTLLVLMREC